MALIIVYGHEPYIDKFVDSHENLPVRLIAIPVRLRLAALFLFLSIPIAVLETVIASRAPWWRLPQQSIAIWSGASFLICVPLSIWLIQGRSWALGLVRSYGVAWCILTAWIAYRFRHPALGFFTIFLVWYFGGLIIWLRNELGRSYFDPQMKWFQGFPKPIPGLTCELDWNGKKGDFRVSRMDKEGTFLFFDRPASQNPIELGRMKSGQAVELVFKFRDRQVKCQGLPVRAFEQGTGIGLQFSKLLPDVRKDLGDFVELLRGEGYV